MDTRIVTVRPECRQYGAPRALFISWRYSKQMYRMTHNTVLHFIKGARSLSTTAQNRTSTTLTKPIFNKIVRHSQCQIRLWALVIEPALKADTTGYRHLVLKEDTLWCVILRLCHWISSFAFAEPVAIDDTVYAGISLDMFKPMGHEHTPVRNPNCMNSPNI
ncbi:hypothetical protein BDN67DRAFT_473800 [Paxillus ammoniavirescens]|nr:hypothetical protein BDN67DRAFT_473800 [Paxillus ammoniavirescens]